MYPEEQLLVNRVIMIKTGAYCDQYIRPYTATVQNQQVLNLFSEVTAGGANVQPANIAAVAGQMLQPRGQVTGISPIQNGWSQSRIRFIIEAVHISRTGNRKTYLVQGYSDQPGYSQSGAIDPMMLLYMNNVVVLQEQSYVDPATGIPVRRMIDTSQVLYRAPDYQFNGMGQQMPRMQTMLPSEVVQNIGIVDMQQKIGADVMNLCGSFNESPIVKSNRTNALASRYLSKSVTAMTAAIRENTGGALIDTTNRASTFVQDAPVSQDDFITMMSNRTPFVERGYITWGELVSVFPSIDSVTMIIDRQFQNELMGSSNNVAMGAVTSMATDVTRDIRNLESWADSSRETVVANTLAFAVPAVMMECFLANLSFTITNMTLTGQPQLTITAFDTFLDGLDITPYLQRFTQVLEHEIMANVSYNNQHAYNLFMNVNILGDTYINIALNGGIAKEYLMPSFCDALAVPVVTLDALDKNALSSGILTLVTEVRENQSALGTTNFNQPYQSFL